MVNLYKFSNYPDLFTPKRQRKYVLVWCSKGSVTMMVDEKELVIRQHQLLTITSGQIYSFKKGFRAEGFILEFTLDFFCRNDNDIELIFHNGLFCHFDLNEVIPVDNYTFIESQLNHIRNELTSTPYQYLITVHSRIELILVEINRAKVARGDEIWKPDAMFLRFLELVRENFQHNYSLAQLAKMLGVTVATLNEHSKRHTGRTAQNVIYGLIVSEARRMLMYQKLSVKEVAFGLGFKDPFYFSNFFKKHTRLSPKVYQSRHAI